jgi:hypothetical protein
VLVSVADLALMRLGSFRSREIRAQPVDALTNVAAGHEAHPVFLSL